MVRLEYNSKHEQFHISNGKKMKMESLVEKYYDKIKYPLSESDRTDENCTSIYLVFNPVYSKFKIGITKNFYTRFRQLRTQSGFDLIPLLILDLEVGYDEKPIYIESFLHSHFKNKRTIGEWFNLNFRDIIEICNLFYMIEGEDIKDNIKETFIDESGKIKPEFRSLLN